MQLSQGISQSFHEYGKKEVKVDKLRLRTFDGIVVTGFLMLPPLFYTGLSKLVEQNKTAAWIALLAAFVITLCLFLITASLMKRYEDKNIIEITSIVMGRPFGIIYGVALGAYFCYFTGIHIRESAEILKIYGLNLTPLHILTGLILLAAVIMNFFGGRAIIKSAGFFFIIIIVGIIFVMLLGLNRYNPDNLVPVLGNGVCNIAKNSLFITSLFDGTIILFLFAPAFSNATKIKKAGVIAMALAAAVYVSLGLCYVMMFSSPIASTMMSGFIEMGKASYYNHFFYRFESILLFFLIFLSVMLASIGLFIAKESVVCTFYLKKSKIIIIACTVPILIAMLIPANILDLTQIYIPVIRQYSVLFIAGFPLLVLIISILKGLLGYEKN